MRTWGYTSGSFCVVLGLMSLVLAVLLLVVAKSDVSAEFKNNSVGVAVVVLILAVVAMILGGVTVWKIYLANQLYLRVSSEAAQGQIAIGRPVSLPKATPPVVVAVPLSLPSLPSTAAATAVPVAPAATEDNGTEFV